MSEPRFTKGPWLREGNLVYALQHHGWRKGEETFCNRFSAGFSIGPGCSEEELIANATLAQAAPELFRALQEIVALPAHPMRKKAVEIASAALAKALGGS